jgi:hypothetical protein
MQQMGEKLTAGQLDVRGSQDLRPRVDDLDPIGEIQQIVHWNAIHTAIASKLLGAAASPGYDDKGADMTGDVVQAGKNLIHKVEVDLA